MDLQRQLPRRHQHQRLRRLGRAWKAGRRDLFNERQAESSRLAGARLGNRHQVRAGQQNRNGLGLDRGWCFEFFGAQSAKYRFGKSEHVERSLGQFGNLSRGGRLNPGSRLAEICLRRRAIREDRFLWMNLGRKNRQTVRRAIPNYRCGANLPLFAAQCQAPRRFMAEQCAAASPTLAVPGSSPACRQWPMGKYDRVRPVADIWGIGQNVSFVGLSGYSIGCLGCPLGDSMRELNSSGRYTVRAGEAINRISHDSMARQSG